MVIVLVPAERIEIKVEDNELLKLIQVCETFVIPYKYSPRKFTEP